MSRMWFFGKLILVFVISISCCVYILLYLYWANPQLLVNVNKEFQHESQSENYRIESLKYLEASKPGIIREEKTNNETAVEFISQERRKFQGLQINTPRSETEFNFYINTRKLVLFAVQRMNQIIKSQEDQIGKPIQCAKWWANPFHTHRNIIVTSTHEYDDHWLEFEAVTKWDKITFQVFVRVYLNKIPQELEFFNNSFKRVPSSINEILLTNNKKSVSSCLSSDMESNLLLQTICSCHHIELEKKETGQEDLFSWPKNVSFLVGDYIDYANSSSLFNILPYLDNNKLDYCESLNMLVMVSSAPTHFEQRDAIRQTYGNESYLVEKNVKVVFLFGRVLNETLQEVLENEASNYSDIIQANFMDSYHNLTLSHLLMYSFIYFTCSSESGNDYNNVLFDTSNYHPPKHILKADDDFFLNIDLSMKIAQANPDVELIGCSYCGTGPVRDIAYMTKYYTPRYMYLGESYPGYLSGVAYMIRSDVIPRFLEASLSTPIIHMDDVYITGLLPKALGIYPRNSKRFSYGKVTTGDIHCALRKMACSYILSPDDLRTTYETWKFKNDSIENNCIELTVEELKVEELSDQFKASCRYD